MQGTIDKYFKQTNIVNPEKKKYFCCKCDCTLIGITEKQEHEKLCNKKKCSVCQKTFWTAENYSRHLHNCPPKRYNCSFCLKSYSRKSDKEKHEKTHPKCQKKNICHFCGKVFLLTSLLDRHIADHLSDM
jgi:hypothetical protein